MVAEKQYIDELSGVFNRRYLNEVLGREVQALHGRRVSFSLVLVDIDRFKEVNDVHGHLRGDQVIQEFARFLRSSIRPYDRIIRYGGDEFLCYMQGIGRGESERIYQRILERCRFRKMADLPITISVGIAEFPEDSRDLSELIKIADESLYDAKRSGRDRLGEIKSKHLEIPIKAFVDRQQEKEQLSLYLMAAEERAKVIVVKGTVGIGKTRLVKEVLNRISYREVLWADCLSLSDEMSYYCIRELLKYKLQRRGRGVLAEIPPAYQVEIVKLVPELAEAISAEARDIGPILDKYRLFEGVRKFLELGEIKKIIVIDNIQWMDRDSPGVIRYLLRSLQDRDISFILICRSEEMTREWEDFIAGVGREVELYEVELRHFETTAIRESIRLALGEQGGDRLANYIIKKSGGNPYYIEELLRELHLQHYLAIEQDSWRFREPEEMLVPKKVIDVIQQKYQHLNPEAQNLLDVASVAGGFDLEILAAITGYNPGHVEGLIDDIKRQGLVSEERGKLLFREEIAQHAIYKKRIEGMRGQELHRQVAVLLEERNRGVEINVLEELAHHYYRARDLDKGVEYSLQAAERAVQKYSTWDAIRYYGWALDLMKLSGLTLDHQRTWQVTMKRLHHAYSIGEPQKLLSEYDTLLKVAKRGGDKTRIAEVLHRQALILAMDLSRYQRSLILERKALAIYKRSRDRQGIAKALNIIGVIHRNLAQYPKAIDLLEQAAAADSADQGKAKAWTNLGNIYFSKGELDRSCQYYRKAIKVYQGHGDRVCEALVLGNLSEVTRARGDLDQALDLLQRTIRIKRVVGDRRGEAMSLISLGNLHADLDEYPKALESYQEALKINVDVHQTIVDILGNINLGLIYKTLGSYAKASGHLDHALALCQEVGDRKNRPLALTIRGDVCFRLGDLAEARRFYLEAAKSNSRTYNHMVQFSIASSLTAFNIEEGSQAKASQAMAQVLAIAKAIKARPMDVQARQLSAELHLKRDDHRAALAELKAMKLLIGSGHRGFQGQYHLLMGRALLAAGKTGDSHRSLKLAREIFRALGLRIQEGIADYWLGVMQLETEAPGTMPKHLEEAFAVFDSLGAKAWRDRTQAKLKAITPPEP